MGSYAIDLIGGGIPDQDIHLNCSNQISIPSRKLEVTIDTLLLDKNFLIRRVTPGTIPHTVRFCNPSHTVAIFNHGSFIEGERRVNGCFFGAPGPLDIGIDIIPANMNFHAVVGPGSKIDVILISVFEEATRHIKNIALRPEVMADGELLLSLASRMRDLCKSDKQSIDRYHVTSVSSLLFHEIVLAQKVVYLDTHTKCTGGLSSRARRLVREFLSENLDEKIDLDDVAGLVGLSRFHFSRAFKVTFGISPYKYLLKIRLDKATELLKNTNIAITDVALDVGFSTSSEFARAFRQEMNCTPREYRLQGRTSLRKSL